MTRSHLLDGNLGQFIVPKVEIVISGGKLLDLFERDVNRFNYGG